MHRLFFLLALLLTAARVFSQEFSVQQYSIPEGLPQSQIFALEEDRYGYLWIGTASGGLTKYDGRSFTRYSTRDGLLSNLINDIKVDDANNLWIAHVNGISKFDGTTFKTFQVPDTIELFRRILSIHLEGDTVHISSLPSIYGRIVGDSLHYWNRSPFPGKRVATIFRGPERALYFFLDSREVFIRKGNVTKWLPLRTTEWIPQIIYNLGNSVVMGTADGASEINFGEGTSRLIEGEWWRRRLMLYDSVTGDRWYRGNDSLTIENGARKTALFLGTTANRVRKDAEGNFWVATNEKGLFKVNRRSLRKIGSTAGLKASNMLVVDGDLWLGTYEAGIFRYRNGTLTRLFFDERDQTRNIITGIAVSPQGEVWVSTLGGVGVFDPKGAPLRWITEIRRGRPLLQCTGVVFDADGVPWVGTLFLGSIAFRPDTTLVLNGANSILPNNVSSSLYLPFYKKVAIGHLSGYSLADKDTIRPWLIPGVKNSPVTAMGIYQDSLVLLSTLGAGMVIHSPASGRWSSYHSKNGLDSDFIYFSSADSEGNIWVGSERGISRIRINTSWELTESRFYPTPEADQESVSLEQGKYFGTLDGVYEYVGDHTSASSNVFPLHFTGIEHEATDHGDYSRDFYTVPENLRLPFSKNRIAFAFNQIDKSGTGAVRYSYKLENFDPDWSSVSHLNHVRYSNLPAGQYTFRVRAATVAGGFQDQELSYGFQVIPPFYRTPVFIGLAVITIILLAGGTIYWRIRARINQLLVRERMRSEEQAKLRREMAQDFHDEMGNQLARIINYTGQLQLNTVQATPEAQLYRKIEQTARNLFQGTREFIWSMNPDNENTSEVFHHIRDFGEKILQDKGIAFRADNELAGIQELPFGFSRQINLVFKEAITNVYKYARATEVRFTLRHVGEGFEFSLSDNGEGFLTETMAEGHGLSNMQARAHKIRAQLNIHSEAGRGTRISLRIDNLKRTPYVDHSFQKKDSHY